MAGFVLDLDAVTAVGVRVRGRAVHADPGVPQGLSGCGAGDVVAAWDEALRRLVAALSDRVIPVVARWGADVEHGGVWARERDGALGAWWRQAGADGAVPSTDVPVPGWRDGGDLLPTGGSWYAGDRGPGAVWDEDDPGRGDLAGVQATGWWLDTYGTVLTELLSVVQAELPVLEGAWTGVAGSAFVEGGRVLAAEILRFARCGGASGGAELAVYACRVQDIADRAAWARARRAEAEAERAGWVAAIREVPTVDPSEEDVRRRFWLAGLEDEARVRVARADLELADLAQERAAADRAVVRVAEDLAASASTVLAGWDRGGSVGGGSMIRPVGSVGNTSVPDPADLDDERAAVQALLSTRLFWRADASLLVEGLADGSLQVADLIAVLHDLSAEERDRLDQIMGVVRWFHPEQVRDLSSRILAGAASAAQVASVTRRFPFLEPGLLAGHDWSARERVVLDPDRIDGADVGQGAADDCWLIAGIGAVAAVDLDRIAQNIVANPNGTYTVTIYDDDGEPVPVTVSGYVPVRGDGTTDYAGTRDDLPNWVSIYEKAAAQVLGDGTYDGLTAGRPSTGISAITGVPTTLLGTNMMNALSDPDDSTTFERVSEAVAEGRPVTALVTFTGSDDTIVPWHVYYVTGIEGDRIVVENPWGLKQRHSSIEQTLSLTEEEFDRTFAWASVGDPS